MDYTWYTDGSCLKNPGGAGGWAFLCVEHPEWERTGTHPSTTNNIMELTACIECIDFIINNNINNVTHTLYTDSTYVKNGINIWIHNWLKNDWKTANKQDVKNKLLWIKLYEQTKQLEIEWKWVKGHHTDIYNTKVDLLARNAAKSDVML